MRRRKRYRGVGMMICLSMLSVAAAVYTISAVQSKSTAKPKSPRTFVFPSGTYEVQASFTANRDGKTLPGTFNGTVELDPADGQIGISHGNGALNPYVNVD